MAIYHLTVKTVSRGGTASAGSRHDYIERKGRYKNDQEEVLYKVNKNMPNWAKKDPGQYWKNADLHERKNGRLFKQIEFALPKELKPEQQIKLTQDFCETVTRIKTGKLPYSFAIHKGHEVDNPHCHLIISECINDGHNRSPETWFKRANKKNLEKGGAIKTTELMPKNWLLKTRELWSVKANKTLKQAGFKERIDHRTLEAQGIDREPTKHRGPALNAMLKKEKLKIEDVEKPIKTAAEIEAEQNEARRLLEEINRGKKQAEEWYQQIKSELLEKEKQEQIQKNEELQKRKELDMQKKQSTVKEKQYSPRPRSLGRMR